MISTPQYAPEMPLSDLLCFSAPLDNDVLVRGVQIDSRRVCPGDLFLAVPGERCGCRTGGAPGGGFC